MRLDALRPTTALLIALLIVAGSPGAKAGLPRFQTPIAHIVVIMQENHSFDNYFGTFPGANGLSKAPAWAQAKAFHARAALDPCECYPSGYYNGTNWTWPAADNFGYYNGSDIPVYWQWARQYVLLDNYYASFMGPTLPNHLFLVAGQNGGITNDLRSGINGNPVLPTIFNLLSVAHLTWAYYADTSSGVYAAANNWDPLPLMGNESYLNHLFPRSQTLQDLASGNLPNVSWVMPFNETASEHPVVMPGQGMKQTALLVNAIMDSKYWNSTAILLTWDESGGFYDHVVPPMIQGHQVGFRVPLLVISPWAEQGMIDHTLADHTSTLAFIESVFGLPCLARDCHMQNLFEAFDFRPSVHYDPGVLAITAGRHKNATIWVGLRNNLDQFVNVESSPLFNGSALFPLNLQRGSYTVVVILLVNQVPIDAGFEYSLTV